MAFVAAIVATFVILQAVFVVKNLKKVLPKVREKRWYIFIQKLCHCGPVICFIIVSIVVYFLKILELNFHASTPKWIPILHSMFSVYIWLNITFNYFAAMITKPGKPSSRQDLHTQDGKPHEDLEFCASCQRLRTYGTHHCNKCGICIRMLCHHSSFINNCIGLSNFAYYFCFLVYAFFGLMYALYMTYPPFHACYIHDHQVSDISLKYPALNFYVCENVGELPLLFILVIMATIIIGSLLGLHCILLAADLSYISFVRHVQQSSSVVSFLTALVKKCFKKQRRVKFNILLRQRKKTWKHFLVPTFNILDDGLTLDDLMDDDQCCIQMI